MMSFRHLRATSLAAAAALTVGTLALATPAAHAQASVAAGTNCVTVNEDGTCTSCKPYTGLNAEKKCVRCQDRNCGYCYDDYTECDTCMFGFGYVGGRCTKCNQANCDLCDGNVDSCDVCADGYHLNGNTCEKCSDGYTGYYCSSCAVGYSRIGASSRCQRCTVPNCWSCSGSTSKCELCKVNYYLTDSGECQPI